MLNENLKKRLVGAAVLISLVVIFVPMLVDDDKVLKTSVSEIEIPPWPEQKSKVAPAPMPPQQTQQVVETKPVEQKSVEQAKPAVQKAEVQTKPPVELKPQAVKKAVELSAWVVQVGSFSSKQNADKLVQDLRKKDLPAYLETVVIDGKKIYRVRIGPDLEEKTAKKFLKRIKQEFQLAGELKRYP